MMAVYHLLYFLSLANAFVTIPEPPGPFRVYYNTMKLTDNSRIDPYAPSPAPRSLMISAFYPVPREQCTRTCTINYLPPATATFLIQKYASFGIPSGILEQLQLQMCCSPADFLADKQKQRSVVLFSPGLGTPRLLYAAIAQSVASSGHLVITIDHPYDADVVEFPDGSLIPSANITVNDTTGAFAVKIRAEDASFVLSQLDSPTVMSQLVPGAKSGLDVHSAVMFGHSLGGATALAAMELNHRIKGGLNMDGSFYGPEIDRGTDRPFVIFENKAHNRTSDDSWARSWPRLKGWKLELTLKESGHNTFTDLPLLAKLLGLTPLLPPIITDNIGTLDGARALEIVSRYVTTFVDFVLTGNQPELLKKPSAEFPEVLYNASTS